MPKPRLCDLATQHHLFPAGPLQTDDAAIIRTINVHLAFMVDHIFLYTPYMYKVT